MTRSIKLDTSSNPMANHLLAINIDGVSISRIILLSENSKSRLLIAFASAVALNVFSSALYDAIKDFKSKETTINGKQVPANEVQLKVLINSQVQINQTSSETNCKPNSDKDSHEYPPNINVNQLLSPRH